MSASSELAKDIVDLAQFLAHRSILKDIIDQVVADWPSRVKTATPQSPPAISPATPQTVEAGQTTVVGTVMPSIPGQTLSLAETAGSGTLALGMAQPNGAQPILYTAPASVTASTLDLVSFAISENGASSLGSAMVQLDPGPAVASQAPVPVEIGQFTLIGTATPGLNGDTLVLAQTAGAGTVSLGAVLPNGTQQVIYTAPTAPSGNAVDPVAYTVSDQHNDAVAQAGASVTVTVAPIAPPSANETVVATVAGGSTSSITDAAGNTWAVANGLVTVNGVVDSTTANVIELAYVNGEVWQENASDLWWAKTTPNDQWTPEYGTALNPVQGSDFTLAGYGNFNVGVLGPGDILLNGGDSLTAAGVQLDGTRLEVSPIFSTIPLILQGDSSLTDGATLDIQELGTGSLPNDPLENDGSFSLSASTLEIGNLTGQGAISATDNSTLDIGSATSSGETILLGAANLSLGGPLFAANPGLTFLPPVTEFGSTSSISLYNTQATSEVFAKTAPTAGELSLYNGTTLVADLHISGQANIYASYNPVGEGTVTLTPYDTGHSLPIIAR